jgi:23S rRNA (guanosine2251-2'-O)-methyltransferase
MAGGNKGGVGGRGNKAGSHRKGAAKGSGGQVRRGLAGKGPTPPAEARKGHPKARKAAAAKKRADTAAKRTGAKRPAASGARGGARRRSGKESAEYVAGRNSVVEALRVGIPATALLVAVRIDSDDRVREALKIANSRGIPLLEAPRTEIDRLSNGAVHQGLALQVPAYEYADAADLLSRAKGRSQEPLVVALDGVTDPRNLGAVVRSAAAFGAHGVVVPERRAAGMTASAWKTSAGAAARVPVARVTNLTRSLQSFAKDGLTVVGLAADGDLELADFDVATDGLVLVIGSEGKGLSRLVSEACDYKVRIPIASDTESLNAGVAAGIVLHEVARRRGL